MQRFLAIGGVLLLIFVLILFYIVSDIKSARPAIVHLKPNVADSADREGGVTSTDRYVTVETDKYGKETFTWDQIQYISEKDASSRRLDRVVDLIDLLSKFGLVATVLFFTIGLYQYSQGQKWEREKFLVAAVKDFDSKKARHAKQMLDSLAWYPPGRPIDLVEAERSEGREQLVTNQEIYSALTIKKEEVNSLVNKALLIRECFDEFLGGLVTFCHYIDQGLITKEALEAHLGYWIDLLGPDGRLDAEYKYRVLKYADEYMGHYVTTLLRKYYKNYDWASYASDQTGSAASPLQPRENQPNS